MHLVISMSTGVMYNTEQQFCHFFCIRQHLMESVWSVPINISRTDDLNDFGMNILFEN